MQKRTVHPVEESAIKQLILEAMIEDKSSQLFYALRNLNLELRRMSCPESGGSSLQCELKSLLGELNGGRE